MNVRSTSLDRGSLIPCTSRLWAPRTQPRWPLGHIPLNDCVYQPTKPWVMSLASYMTTAQSTQLWRTTIDGTNNKKIGLSAAQNTSESIGMETKYANHFKKPYKPVGILKLPIQCHLGIYLTVVSCYFLNSLVYYLSVRITPESLETIQPSPKSFSEPTGAFKFWFWARLLQMLILVKPFVFSLTSSI